MDPAASGRFDKLQSSFKLSIQCLLTACSREDVNDAFSSFTDAEKERLHRMLTLVSVLIHALSNKMSLTTSAKKHRWLLPLKR
ncbi:rubredoxin family protein [Zea mays]|uniref:Rubredoxin family protein n=1 Tax=Zea mays TaxID=4577 RepID=A0A1D6IZS4_MAIZE|nr:rubredoxin family protein [Zea mays]